MNELLVRTATAVAAIVVFLVLTFFAPDWLWALFIACVIGVAAWEWGRLVKLSAIEAVGYAGVTVALLALLWRVTGIATGAIHAPVAAAAVIPALFFWIALAPVMVWFQIPLRSRSIGLVLGWVTLLGAGIAALGLREVSSGLLLSAVTLVWIADTAAFFVGRRYGSRKLLEAVSPGKTWAGFWGALGAVAAYGAALYPVMGVGQGVFGWVLAFVGVALLAVMGDLFESWLKRNAGVKDSGGLLPGHGGVLDRIDALLAVLPITALWWLHW
jgi:phosphatidate cytidylyltransferase